MSLEQPGSAATAAQAPPASPGPSARPTPEPQPVSPVNDAPRLADTTRSGPRVAEPRDRSTKRRARKVRRIVRRVDAWSILKFSLLFYFCTFLILMVAGVLLWAAARSAGTIEGIEGFIEQSGGYDFFRFEGDQIFRAAALGGLVLVVAGSAGNVLLAVLFNLISDLTGGIRLTVIEEEGALPLTTRRTRRSSKSGSGTARQSRPEAVRES